jgi:hypothetical protein
MSMFDPSGRYFSGNSAAAGRERLIDAAARSAGTMKREKRLEV